MRYGPKGDACGGGGSGADVGGGGGGASDGGEIGAGAKTVDGDAVGTGVGGGVEVLVDGAPVVVVLIVVDVVSTASTVLEDGAPPLVTSSPAPLLQLDAKREASRRAAGIADVRLTVWAPRCRTRQ